jgi:hypothetical protein
MGFNNGGGEQRPLLATSPSADKAANGSAAVQLFPNVVVGGGDGRVGDVLRAPSLQRPLLAGGSNFSHSATPHPNLPEFLRERLRAAAESFHHHHPAAAAAAAAFYSQHQQHNFLLQSSPPPNGQLSPFLSARQQHLYSPPQQTASKQDS